MDLFRLFRRGQRAERRGQPPVVEAALRAKRARDHLARKRRRHAGRGDERPAPAEARSCEGRVAAAEVFAGRAAVPDEVEAPAVFPDAFEPSGERRAPVRRPVPAPAPASAARARRSSVSGRAVVPAAPPMPRFLAPATTLLAFGLGYAASGPLFVHVWLPRVPLTRVAVVGTAVRAPVDVARSLWPSAGAPLDRVDADYVRTRLTEDPWIESAESFRLPTGTLVVRVDERRAIARYRSEPEGETRLLDPNGRLFPGETIPGEVEAAGALPLVEGPIDGEESLSPIALEILAEVARHTGLSADPARLTLHLPGSAGLAAPIRLHAVDLSGGAEAARSADAALAAAVEDGGRAAEDAVPAAPAEIIETLEGESGYVLALGETGPRALLGQSFLKRRIARLAVLLGERNAVLAGARVIDLRFADRAVLRTGPTSG